jgi:hypothetical protein
MLKQNIRIQVACGDNTDHKLNVYPKLVNSQFPPHGRGVLDCAVAGRGLYALYKLGRF